MFARLDECWWLYPVLFLLPDVSTIGYLRVPHGGGIIYNVVHHKALAIVIHSIEFFAGNALLPLAGLILLGHSSLDRVLRFGLKHLDSFENTYLGPIGASLAHPVIDLWCRSPEEKSGHPTW